MTAARANPFATARISRELPFDPAWCGTTWPTLHSRLAEQRHRGLITGPHGSGKTTLLDTLAQHYADRGLTIHHWLLNDGQHRPPWDTLAAGGAGAMLLIDGSERLSPLAWYRVWRETRHWAGLIATDHWIWRPGRPGRPPLLIQTRTRPEMLTNFVDRLAPGHPFSGADLATIFQKSRGNLREALWHCYDQVARH